MKKLLLLSTLVFKLAHSVEIEPESLFVPQQLGKIAVYHNKEKFWVHHKGGYHKIENWNTDKNIRQLDQVKLLAFLKAGGYLKIDKVGNDYTVKASMRVLGGGVIGATVGAAVGKGTVSAIGHGTILGIASLVSTVGTPVAGTAVGLWLEGLFGPAIEAASIHAAVVCGIAGAVATGPV